jgi:hypothetical protein
MRLVKVVHEWPGAILVPPVSVKLDLEAPQIAGSRQPAGSAKGKPIPQPGMRSQRSSLRGGLGPGEPSWWTARATAGEVTGGFTKEEILRKPEADPRAEGGMFSRLESLLRALL